MRPTLDEALEYVVDDELVEVRTNPFCSQSILFPYPIKSSVQCLELACWVQAARWVHNPHLAVAC